MFQVEESLQHICEERQRWQDRCEVGKFTNFKLPSSFEWMVPMVGRMSCRLDGLDGFEVGSIISNLQTADHSIE